MVYWYHGMGLVATNGDNGVTVTVPGATISANDIVYVRTNTNGSWSIYSIKAQRQ